MTPPTARAEPQPLPAEIADVAHARQLRVMAGNIMFHFGSVLSAIGQHILDKAHQAAELDIADAYHLGHGHGHAEGYAHARQDIAPDGPAPS